MNRLLRSPLIQTKLTVSNPGDEYEREADRVADKVMRMPEPAARLQRKCDCGSSGASDQSCENCANRSLKLQRRATSVNESGAMSAPAIVQDTLGSPGRALDQNTRTFFENRFGHDFSNVRIHTDEHASRSAESVNALAYTVGNSIVFRAGTYSPHTTGGQKLLAHELTHVVQQGGVHRSVQRQAGTAPPCPPAEPHEIETSHSEAGFLSDDVTVGSGRLIISDFGIDWRHIKSSAVRNPLLVSWLERFENDDSYRLEIIGYSDCFGPAETNIQLRQRRAENVERLLGPRARLRVNFRGMEGLGAFLVPNNNTTNRARNRSVVIEFHQELTFPPETITGTPHRCGPDVTQWLIDQMDRNQDHPTIRTMRENRWPRYIPIFNIGWTGAALADFASLVRGGAIWDFKSRQGNARTGAWRARPGRACPTTDCDRTVTICDMCFNYDVPGNIHFGWIGAAAQLRSWILHFGAGVVQPGRWTDDPKDAVAVEIGEARWDSGADLCSELRSRRSDLNLEGTQDCPFCRVP
ncbi:MAG TPA: DUF4157 domain-containing protein [Pyrinomonadaceae bacterium]|nr:DUF4157 domain-containing protein [Pyrinomonadaceae bacterium]